MLYISKDCFHCVPQMLFSFSFCSKYFLITLEISSLTHMLFKSVLVFLIIYIKKKKKTTDLNM